MAVTTIHHWAGNDDRIIGYSELIVLSLCSQEATKIKDILPGDGFGIAVEGRRTDFGQLWLPNGTIVAPSPKSVVLMINKVIRWSIDEPQSHKPGISLETARTGRVTVSILSF